MSMSSEEILAEHESFPVVWWMHGANMYDVGAWALQGQIAEEMGVVQSTDAVWLNDLCATVSWVEYERQCWCFYCSHCDTERSEIYSLRVVVVQTFAKLPYACGNLEGKK